MLYKNWQVPCISWPYPNTSLQILLCQHFPWILTLVVITWVPHPNLFYHNILFLCVGICFTSVWNNFYFSCLLLAFKFLLHSDTGSYLVSVPACSPSRIRDIHLSDFQHLLLWSSVETQGREERKHVQVGECSSFALSHRTLSLCTNSLASSGKGVVHQV